VGSDRGVSVGFMFGAIEILIVGVNDDEKLGA